MAAFSRSFASRWSLPLLFGLAGACTSSSAPPKGQLMVALSTDMSIPKDVSRIRVRVKLGAEVRYEYDYIIAPDGKFHIPGTLAVVEGSTPNPVVAVEVIGMRTKAGKLQARTFGKAITSIPSERTALLEMPVQWLCDGQVADLGEESFVTTCDPNLDTGEETACVAGTCKPVGVSPDALPTFSPRDVFGGGVQANDPNAHCFDTLTCFDRGTSLGAAELGAGCTYTLPDDGSTPNFAVVTSDAGICHEGDAPPCYVPLDLDDRSGWHFAAEPPAGKRVAVLPAAVCQSLADERADAVRFTTACETKTSASPTCGDWSAISTPLPPTNPGGGTGGSAGAGNATGQGGEGTVAAGGAPPGSGGKVSAGGQPGKAGAASGVGGSLGVAGGAVDVGGTAGQATNGGDAGAASIDAGAAGETSAQGGNAGSGGVAGAGPAFDCTGDIELASSGLESILRERLGKPTEPLTGADLASLTTLNASFSNVTSLSGMECAVNLQSANFSNNTIADLGPLAGLQSLIALNLSQNVLTDLTPLTGITTLTSVDVSYNYQLTSVDGLENVAGDVNAAGCSISDVSALTGNTGITTLDVSSNQIADAAPLATLGSLGELNLNYNPLSSFAPLGSLPATVTRLDLSGTGVTDLSPLASLTGVFALSLNTNALTDADLAAISGMTWLGQLYVAENQLTTLAALAGMTSLDSIYAPFNLISDLSALAGLPNLTLVNLSQNQVGDVSPLVENVNFATGDTLNVNDNPLCDTGNVNALIERGVYEIQNIGGCS